MPCSNRFHKFMDQRLSFTSRDPLFQNLGIKHRSTIVDLLVADLVRTVVEVVLAEHFTTRALRIRGRFTAKMFLSRSCIKTSQSASSFAHG